MNIDSIKSLEDLLGFIAELQKTFLNNKNDWQAVATALYAGKIYE